MFKLSKVAGSVIAAAALLGGAGTALADAYKSKGRVAYERPTNWSGFYFGVGGGYQWSDIGVSIPGTALAFDADQDSGIVSAFLGYQHQFGQVVLGVEGGWKSAFRDDFGSTECPPVPSGLSCEARFNDVLTIGGRIGFAAGHWMPYATGGYASGRFEHEVRSLATGILDNSASTRNDGWYLGGGVEWQVSPGWTAGLEYRHYEFEDAVGPAHTPGGAFVNDREIDASVDTITARVAWRWGRPEPKPLK